MRLPFKLTLTASLCALACGVVPAAASASTVRVAKGKITFKAAPGERNRVVVQGSTVLDSGSVITAGAGCTAVSKHEVNCEAEPSKDTGEAVFSVNLGDRNDRGRAKAEATGVIRGGSGNDRLTGSRRANTLRGDSGDDRLVGGGGRDRFDGGSGRDRLISRDHRRERVNCGGGSDRVRADRADRLRGCEHIRLF